jgi:HEPN domain
VKRNDLRALATLRLSEARLLLNHRHWDGTYYLAGYAVEIAIKACIAKRNVLISPDKRSCQGELDRPEMIRPGTARQAGKAERSNGE